MEVGEQRNFVYIPLLGMIESGDTKSETLARIRKAEVKREIADKKLRRRLQKEYPGCEIVKNGNHWTIKPKK